TLCFRTPCSLGLRDQVSAWSAGRGAPRLPAWGVRQGVHRLRSTPGRDEWRGRSRPPVGGVPAEGCGVDAGELAEGRVVPAAAQALPGADTPRSPVVAVLLRRVVRWRPVRDHPTVRRATAETELKVRLTPA